LKRGTFKNVEESIAKYKKQGISALYLMGVFERDNHMHENKVRMAMEYKKEDAHPLAVTTRETANSMLGGDDGFGRVMKECKKHKIKVLVDSLTRISSSRHHRKYKNLLFSYLNDEGRREICYGTDG
jgi:glycosidase